MALIILDVDGTLVDTNYQHAIAWFRAFRDAGIVLPVWRLHRHIGMGGDQLVGSVAGADSEARVGDLVRARKRDHYAPMLQETELLEGARELLADLRERGETVILASSAQSPELEHYLDLLDARHLVAGWTGADDVAASKPQPDLVRAAIDKAGVGADDAVMVGDSPWDVEAAARAGVPTLAVLTGGFSAAELTDAGAIDVCPSLADLRRSLSRARGSRLGEALRGYTR